MLQIFNLLAIITPKNYFKGLKSFILTLIMLGFLENAKIGEYNMCVMGINVGTFVDQQLQPHSETIYFFSLNL